MVTNRRSGCSARLSGIQFGKGFPTVQQELVGTCHCSSTYVSQLDNRCATLIE
jgi:hypothetical protein